MNKEIDFDKYISSNTPQNDVNSVKEVDKSLTSDKLNALENITGIISEKDYPEDFKNQRL